MILNKQSLAQFPESIATNTESNTDHHPVCSGIHEPDNAHIEQEGCIDDDSVGSSGSNRHRSRASLQSQLTIEDYYHYHSHGHHHDGGSRNIPPPPPHASSPYCCQRCYYHYSCCPTQHQQQHSHHYSHAYRLPEDMAEQRHRRFQHRCCTTEAPLGRGAPAALAMVRERVASRLRFMRLPQWARLPWDRIALDMNETAVPQPLPRWAPYTIVLILAVPYFLASLDQTILSTLTPRVANDQEELFQTSWVTSSYLASLTAFMLFYGKLASIFGPLRILFLAFIIFLGGSVLTAVARNMMWLILARTLAGLGAGGVISVTQTVTAQVGAWHERGQYMGILGAIYGLGTTIGPLLGGLVADNWTWRISFYTNVPLVCITILLVALVLRATARPQSFAEKAGRVDFFGALMLVTGLMLLLLGLTWGGRVYPWISPVVIICLSVGLMLLCVFFFVEKRLALEPIIDARLFSIRNVAMCVLTEMCVGAVFFNTTFNLPVYYSSTQNSSASESGVLMVPLAFGVVVFSVLSGWLIAQYSVYRQVAWAGTMAMTLGAGLLCLFDGHIRTAAQVPILLLLGAGIGSCIQAFLLTAQASVQPLDLAVTTALATFSQTVGGIMGLAFGSIVSESSTRHHLVELARRVPAHAAQIAKAQNDVNEIWAPDIPESVKLGIIRAYARGLQYNFALIACLSAVAMVLAASLQSIRQSKPSLSGERSTAAQMSESTAASGGRHTRHGLDLTREDHDNATLLAV
ncbi:hypothetical protein H4217_000568 [Coemansia sp. RSA 1939]|nr:hypothetical protein H4217_000568 [Coemansia sp. RSA 1939]